jgi:hypothetical protein
MFLPGIGLFYLRSGRHLYRFLVFRLFAISSHFFVIEESPPTSYQRHCGNKIPRARQNEEEGVDSPDE